MRKLLGLAFVLLGALIWGGCTNAPATPDAGRRACGIETDSCQGDDECCSGRCRDSGFAVFGNTCTCTASGEICSGAGECCAGLVCLNHLCQCTPSGRACSRTSPCCTGLTCLSGTCR